jgi:cell division protease FtsH
MLKAAYEEAKRLLTENREALDKIAAFLIEKETITGKEFMKIFHEVQGIEMEEEETSKEDVLKEETVQEEKKEAIAVVEESEFAEAAQEHHDNEE